VLFNFAHLRCVKFIFTSFLVFISPFLGAQNLCLTAEKTLERIATNESYRIEMQRLDSLSMSFKEGRISSESRDVKQYNIPVVVHVLYEYEENNISPEQIHAQIDALNRDFNWEQSDKDKIPGIWQGIGKESGFRFHLADKDPNGDFTTGITRTKTSIKGIGSTDFYYNKQRGGINPWPLPHYVNIWVCALEGNLLGFSYLPSNSVEPNDGIVIDPRAFGSIGTAQSPYNLGRTLVHEMGHYFGLRHPWGNEEGSCTDSDYMNDTPWQREANFGCKNFPTISCSSEPDGDMFVNFMDYSNDSCSLLFTKDQVNFMQLIIRTSKVTLLHSPAITGMGEESINSRIAIYPNPSSGVFQADFFEDNSTPFEVKDALGRTVQSGIIESGNKIDLTRFDDGMYFLVSSFGVQKLMLKKG
jgi:hypothetical protein